MATWGWATSAALVLGNVAVVAVLPCPEPWVVEAHPWRMDSYRIPFEAVAELVGPYIAELQGCRSLERRARVVAVVVGVGHTRHHGEAVGVVASCIF